MHKTWYASYSQAQSGLAHGSVWESCTITSDWCNSVIWNSSLIKLAMSIHIQRVGEDTSILSLAAITCQGLMAVKNPISNWDVGQKGIYYLLLPHLKTPSIRLTFHWSFREMHWHFRVKPHILPRENYSAFLKGLNFFSNIHSSLCQPCFISKVTHQHANNEKLVIRK